MPAPLQPAAIWRRLAAAVYDGLLLIALAMIVSLFDTIIRDMASLPRNPSALQVLVFSVGLLFFGWFWTHGGQTLGMRAWRIRVRRQDGATLRWPIAAVRYSVMLVTWFAFCLPSLLLSPTLASHVHAGKAAAACTIIAVLAAAAVLLDRRRRSLCDWASGTEVVDISAESPS
jgi:uncharacterized RDD family membrane protein YckC